MKEILLFSFSQIIFCNKKLRRQWAAGGQGYVTGRTVGPGGNELRVFSV